MSDNRQIDIDYVANLARIALTPEEKEAFSRQLGDILAYMEKLDTVDVEGVEPSAHAHDVWNVWQDDVPAKPLPPDAALQNAPARRDQMFVVPKVVEEA